MKEQLKAKLRTYLTVNNMDLFLELQNKQQLSGYLEEQVEAIAPMIDELEQEEKPDYIIEELCMNELIASLRPSRYNYILALLEAEFEQEYLAFIESGILTFEAVNMVSYAASYFDEFGFNESNEDSQHLRYIIAGVISTYLEEYKLDT